MPYQLEHNWEMYSPPGNSGIFCSFMHHCEEKQWWTVRNQLWSPFQQQFAAGWHDDLYLFCSKTWWFFIVPSPAVPNPVPGSLPIPVCNVISGHSLDVMSLKKENYVRHWMTGMNETWLTIPSKPFHFTFPKGTMLPKSICFLKRLWSSHSFNFPMRKPFNFQQTSSIALPGCLQCPPCSHWKCSYTSHMSLTRTKLSQILCSAVSWLILWVAPRKEWFTCQAQ